jgi:transposase
MPAKKEMTMRQMRQVLRLHASGASDREIGRIVGAARSTVRDAILRAKTAGLSWPLPAELSDTALEEKLFVRANASAGVRRRPEPDWAALVRELKRPGVTIGLLHEEYRACHPGGYGYSRFCDLFREFERRLSPTMRQHHVAGDKVFVDYSGKKLAIIDPLTGEIREAEIFVAVLGASNLTYAEATWTQQLADWCGSHVRLFGMLGGVPRLVVPDNLKSAIHKASFYEPEVNRTYGMLAAHYGIGVLPARPRRPKDKSKAESGVLFAQRYILGRLRNQPFFSLVEANRAIGEAMARMNDAVMRRLGVSRRQLFEAVERPALQPLPAEPYVYAEWKFARVGLDYHVEIRGFFYSVPFGLIGQQVDIRLTEHTVEAFHRGSRVAAHERRYNGRAHGTIAEHMPANHRYYAAWSPGRFRSWAASIGPNTEGLILAILASRRHPEQGFRTCIGVLQRLRGLPQDRVETLAARALETGMLTYKGIITLIDARPGRAAAKPAEALVIAHPNVRGPGYFH